MKRSSIIVNENELPGLVKISEEGLEETRAGTVQYSTVQPSPVQQQNPLEAIIDEG